MSGGYFFNMTEQKVRTVKKTKVASRASRKRKKKKGKQSFFSKITWPVWLGMALMFVTCAFFFVYFFVGPYSFRVRSYMGLIDVTYPTDYTIRGLDISRYQEEVDWEVLRNALIHKDPVHFVFIKATEGVSLIDT